MLLITGFFSYRFYRFEEKQIFKSDREKAFLIAEVIKGGLATVMLEGKGSEPQAFINGILADDIETVRLLAPDGTVLGSSLSGETGQKLPLENPSAPKAELFLREKAGRPIYYMELPLLNEGACRKCHMLDTDVLGIVGLELSMQKAIERKSEMLKRGGFYFGSTLVVLSLLLYVLTTFLVNKPLRDMMKKMALVRGGEIQVRFDASRGDEVGHLADSMNSMLERIGKMRHELESCHIEAMQRVEKMATIGELAAAIAHEIKNPLAGISGAMQVFAEDFPESDPRKTIINDVMGEIERLDRAVKDLLSFARPPEPHPVKTSITPVIERVLRMITGQAKKQNVEVDTVTTAERPTYVDPEQMQQVFLNIMVNALHSMPGGGRLTVLTRQEAGKVEISVSDTGRGMSPEEMKNIFRPFYTTKHTGTGLGLAISKNIVEKHGGEISVESQAGVGSTFRITLPGESRNA